MPTPRVTIDALPEQAISESSNYMIVQDGTVTKKMTVATLRKVTRAATASRPILAASDVGTMFMDTSLHAGGKPIWWNGTVWVDSTGVTV
jgi:hypothetical protein